MGKIRTEGEGEVQEFVDIVIVTRCKDSSCMQAHERFIESATMLLV